MINSNNSTNPKWETFDYAAGRGVEVYFNTAVGLEVLLEYRKTKEVDASIDTKLSAFQVRIGFQFHLEKNN